MRKLIIAAATVSVLSGCATWSTSSVNGATVPTKAAVAQTQVSDIQLTETDITDRKYESLGDISVTVNKTTVFHPNPTKEMVNEKLKAEAAKLGANAVILARYGDGGISLFSWGSLEGKGRAIRYVD